MLTLLFLKSDHVTCRSQLRGTWTSDEMDFASTVEQTHSSHLLCVPLIQKRFCTISFESCVWSCHLVFDVSIPISVSLKDQSCRHFRFRFIESRSRWNVLTRFYGHLHLQIQLSSHKSIHHFFNMSLVIVAVVRLVEYSVVIRSNVRKSRCSSWHVISYQVFVLPVLPYPITFLDFP